MNQYFFKLTQEERNNILDKHKHQYDGYATKNITPNQQPLFVQDFANDKNGITVNSLGNLSHYKNVGINEDFHSAGKKEKDTKHTEEFFEEEFFEEEFFEEEFDEETSEFEEVENTEQYEKVDYVNESRVVEVFSEIEKGSKFDEDQDEIKKSILKSLSWFDKLSKK